MYSGCNVADYAVMEKEQILMRIKYGSIVIIYLLILLDTGGAYKRTTHFLFCISILILLYLYKKEKRYIDSKQEMVCKLVILFSGILAAFVGIDTYESVYGVVRLITILLLEVVIQQIGEEERESLIKVIPYLGIGLSLFSIFFPYYFFENSISDAGRLAGTFEYPNTMALFLILGIVIVENMFQRKKWILQGILSFFVLATGSRTAFVLLAGYYIYCFYKYDGRNKKIVLIFGTLIFSILIGKCLEKSFGGLERFLTIDWNASTLQGRILYWEDAGRMIWKYPLGLGYMGYFYLQKVMQTGIYSIRFVHNEWLQLVLDYGVIAGISICIYIRCIFHRYEIQDWKKQILLIIGIYSFFDFHLQYWGIILILLWLKPQGKLIELRKMRKSNLFIWGMIITFFGWIFVRAEIADVYAGNGAYEKAVEKNPLSTEYKIGLMLEAEDLEKASKYTESILNNNSYVYEAYAINSNYAALKRNLNEFILNKKQMLQLNKYEIGEYEEYFEILFMWYVEAKNKNDTEVIEQCVEAMKEIPELIKNVKRDTSIRAFKIKEKPELYFNSEYEDVIQNL